MRKSLNDSLVLLLEDGLEARLEARDDYDFRDSDSGLSLQGERPIEGGGGADTNGSGNNDGGDSERAVAFPEALLLSIGIKMPENWLSAWWLPWLFWRACIIEEVVVYAWAWYNDYSEGYWGWWKCVLWHGAAISASATAFGAYIYLPRSLTHLRNDPFLRSEDVAYGMRNCMRYCIFISILDIGQYLYGATTLGWPSYVFSVWDKHDPSGEGGFEDNFLIPFCTTPALGAILFALSLEVSSCRRRVLDRRAEAEAASLTCAKYVRTNDEICKRAAQWQVSLTILTLVGVWNTIAWLCIFDLSLSHSEPIWFYMWAAVLMFKESILLICILKLLTDVNNAADTITTILLSDRWESHSHEQQQERLNLILLATIHSPSRNASDSTWDYFTAK